MTITSDGAIKFSCKHEPSAPLPETWWKELDGCRARLFSLRLIGETPTGIGYGNISCRSEESGFIITGSATGGTERLDGQHYAYVTSWEIAQNTLNCRGACKASSESLTHAAIYDACPEVAAVIHVHHHTLWDSLRGKAQTTDPDAEYGTVAMAESVRLIAAGKVNGIIIMAGHEEGILAFGTGLAEAMDLLLSALESLGQKDINNPG
ncbi:MAG: class II aldolase/adducin family protein [archaeon]